MKEIVINGVTYEPFDLSLMNTRAYLMGKVICVRGGYKQQVCMIVGFREVREGLHEAVLSMPLQVNGNAGACNVALGVSLLLYCNFMDGTPVGKVVEDGNKGSV